MVVLAKKKLTLTIDEGILREARSVLSGEGKSLSQVVEEYLRFIASTKWVDEVADELGLGELGLITEAEVKLSRPKGADASEVVREIREKRPEVILHGGHE